VIDAVVHPYNLREDNFRNQYARWITDLVSDANRDSGPPGYRMPKDAYERDWSIEEVATTRPLAFAHALASLIRGPPARPRLPRDRTGLARAPSVPRL